MSGKRSCVVLTRRDFLRLGKVLPLFSFSLVIPSRVFAEISSPRGVPVPSPKKKPRAPRLLMIDPGHGGHDPGAIGSSGLMEKDVVLDISLRMAEVLFANQNVQVRLTRKEDRYISLGERVKLGHDARADLFMSIHADSAPNKTARGLSVYTLSQKASDELANAIAERENYADVIRGVDIYKSDQDVAAILCDLAAQRANNTAQKVKAGFVKAVGKSWCLLERPMRSANFAVLRSPDVPSILVEAGFLSNAKDESILKQPKQRQKIAAVMAGEIVKLLGSHLFD